VATDLVSDGDNRIEETRSTVRDELKVEHDCGDNTVDANYGGTGRHKHGSGRCFWTAAAPAALVADNGTWPPGANETDRLGSNALDNGRLWVDVDDCQPYVREEEEYDGVNFTDLNTNHSIGGAAGWVPLWPRSWSATDEATDNSQDVAVVNTREPITGGLVNPPGWPASNVLGVAVTVPNDGRDYEVVVQAVCTYHIDNASVLAGFWLVQDITGGAITDLDFKFVHVDASGGHGSSGAVTLQYTSAAAVTNNDVMNFYVEFAASDGTAANFHTNPSDAVNAFPNALLDMNTLTSWSNIVATIRPFYDTSTYGV
jgi:hypothetical protein